MRNVILSLGASLHGYIAHPMAPSTSALKYKARSAKGQTKILNRGVSE
jgi:hypothetical protein